MTAKTAATQLKLLEAIAIEVRGFLKIQQRLIAYISVAGALTAAILKREAIIINKLLSVPNLLES